MSDLPNCQCHECGRCARDHGGLNHRWVNPYPCPSSTLDRDLMARYWCSLQKDHPGDCIYDSEG